MNNFYWYLSWVPFITVFYFLQSWLTFKNNTDSNKWFWIYFSVTLISVWPIISKFSKDVVGDAFIFDIVMVLSYSIGLLYFTNSLSKFGYNQWIGIGLLFIGMILFKKGI